MSGLPTVACPSCNAQMPLDVLIGHQGARDALLALAKLHPSQARIVMTAIRYAGLWAPEKQALRFDRLAAILTDLGQLIGTGTVGKRGVNHPAPLDYWITAMEDMLANRDRLRLPLASHGYLKSVVASYADRAAASAERTAELARQNGPAPAPGGAPSVAQDAAAAGIARVQAEAAKAKKAIPADVAQFLGGFGKGPKPMSNHKD